MKLTYKILITCLLGGEELGLEYAKLYSVFCEIKPATVRSAVKRLSDDGLLTKVQKNQAWWLNVSVEGKKSLVERFPVIEVARDGVDLLSAPLTGERRNGDRVDDTESRGLYTIVIYSIPEKERVARDMWRRYLVQKGLIRLKKGVFVGFTDRVDELTDKLAGTDWGKRIAGSVVVFRADGVSISASQLAEKMYDMVELYSRYLLFVSQVEGVLRAWQGQKGSVGTAKIRGELIEKYFELVESDPGLPREGYTEGWRMVEATGLFAELVRV